MKAMFYNYQRLSKLVGIIVILLTVFCSGSASAQTSSLASLNNGQLEYTPFAAEGQTNADNVIPDYSFAGYKRGGVALPDVPVVLTISPTGGDDLASIQNAINTVSAMPLDANGFRGAILLTAGEYQVSDELFIQASGVVLRGEGQGTNGTVLNANKQSKHDFIRVKGVGSGIDRDLESLQAITTPYVGIGATSFDVADASGFAIGDSIAVRRTPNQQWIDDLGTDQATMCPNAPEDCRGWDYNSDQQYHGGEGFHINHERIVTGITGNTITIDIPIVDAMETQYGGGEISKASVPGRIENVGIENLRIESFFANDTDENHGWSAILYERVVNSWVRKVTGQYFGYGLIEINRESNFNTIEDCAMVDHKSLISGSRRYSFAIFDGLGNLFQRLYTREGRHDFATQSRVTGPNVFLDCYSAISYNDIGPHQRWATGTLYDNISGREINVRDRNDLGSGHGWAGNSHTFWNLVINEASGLITVENPPGGKNFGIGNVSPNFIGNGKFESNNTPVLPRSLYLQQLEDRLGTEAVLNVTTEAQRDRTIYDQLNSWQGEGDPNVTPTSTITIDNTTTSTSVAEGTSGVIYDVDARLNDGEPDMNIVYSLSGLDAEEFRINAGSGGLLFVNVPDFSNPLDADSDNEYLVDVLVTAGGISETLQLMITVSASIISIDNTTYSVSVEEGATGVVYDVDARVNNGQPDENVVYKISGTDSDAFSIFPSSGELIFASTPDFNNPTDTDSNNEYLVYVSATASGVSDTVLLTITVIPITLSIEILEEGSRKSFIAYPNPATDLINVQFSSGHSGQGLLSIYDMGGSEVYNRTMTINEGTNDVQLSSRSIQLKQGVYFLSIYDGEKALNKRIVIQ
ncbi:MAG: T9SS type A sorting domain-containing protein [Cyclobacteriaceae bacterium]